ncbi:signal recognition particle-docking protein FtsY [Pseudoalteromonas sp. S16_S37]|uniref:signal recognition particle-docking protein FtsY n=1 Tax=Pseudoalteromonas sp. S16_S37 TaxID=2720228 RepID=UPI001681AD83|nr:signal recognition particle-docking protein FtsY [Pseudoalteromonas sp. S16_S37]MBD1581772.1 signal recognition particle-docking protein FtsY [Pseudoalteromonas sp. S16_S37]
MGKKNKFLSWFGFGKKETEQSQQQAEVEENLAKAQAEQEAAEQASREEAERLRLAAEAQAKAQAEQEAAEQAAREEAERQRLDAEAQAKAQAEQEAAEQAAREEAERQRIAAEAQAKAQAEREAAEKAAREEAERQRLAAEAQATAQAEQEAAEQAAREEAERQRLVVEAQAKAQAEREAAEQAAREEAERQRLAAEAQAKAEQEAAEQAAREEAERQRLAAEAQAKAEQEAAEQAAREEAERQRLAAEAQAKAQAEREAAEQVAREEAERQRLAAEAQAKAQAKAQAEQEAAERAAREEAERQRLAAEAQAKAQAEQESAEQAEKPKKEGFFSRLKKGLLKTKVNLGSGIASIFKGKKIDDELFEELETQLLTADLGVDTTMKLIDNLTDAADRKQLKDGDALYELMKQEMADMLKEAEKPLELPENKKPFVILMVGVNGVGKTTTIGKLAKQFQQQGKSVMLAAGDTFRAAAVEQLQVWGERNSIPVIAQHTGADSASVVFDAFQAAQARNVDVLIADTAGRLQNKDNLMQELEKIARVMKKLDPDAPHEVMLTIDAGTGQNAISQVNLFNKAVGLTGITLTKLDGTAKGGVIFAVADKFQIPIRYIGVGEGIDDLRTFKSDDFIEALFSNDDA